MEDEFKHLVRISRKDVDGNKTVEYALTDIKGVGLSLSRSICLLLGFDLNQKIGYMPDEEVKKMLLRVGVDEAKAKLNFDINDSVKIVGGPFDGMIGVVEEINKETEKAKVRLMLFGRDMPVELDFVNIDKI